MTEIAKFSWVSCYDKTGDTIRGNFKVRAASKNLDEIETLIQKAKELIEQGLAELKPKKDL